MRYWKHLQDIANRDVQQTLAKDQTYQGSWQKRGGVGAFMMLARKWDRIESILDRQFKYDVIRGVDADISGADGTVLAEIRDLRSYLMLVEAEVMAMRAERGDVQIKIDPSATVVRPIYGEYSPSDKITIDERLVPRFDTWIGKTVVYESLLTPNLNVSKYRHVGTVTKQGMIADDLCVWFIDGDGRELSVKASECQLAPVPATDSNKYADRDVSRDDGRMVAFISHKQYDVLSEKLKKRYIVTAQYAHLDRGQYSPEDRDAKFMRLHLTLSKWDHAALHHAMQELYEPRQGVADEYQLRQKFREHWGQ
jgi:hypothetical protein